MIRKTIDYSLLILIISLGFTILTNNQDLRGDDISKPPCCLIPIPPPPPPSKGVKLYGEKISMTSGSIHTVPYAGIIKTGEEKIFGIIKSIVIKPTSTLELKVKSTIIGSTINDLSGKEYIMSFKSNKSELIEGFEEGMNVLLFPMQKDPLMYDIVRVPSEK